MAPLPPRTVLLGGVLAWAAACGPASEAAPPARTAPPDGPSTPATAPAPTPRGFTAVHLARTSGPNPCTLDDGRLAELLNGAHELAGDDPTVTGWSYSPWCEGTVLLDGAPMHLRVFLGGLARVEDAAGGRRIFLLSLDP